MKGMQIFWILPGGEEAEGENNTNEMISNEKTTIWWSGDEESHGFLKYLCCFLSMEKCKTNACLCKKKSKFEEICNVVS